MTEDACDMCRNLTCASTETACTIFSLGKEKELPVSAGVEVSRTRTSLKFYSQVWVMKLNENDSAQLLILTVFAEIQRVTFVLLLLKEATIS